MFTDSEKFCYKRNTNDYIWEIQFARCEKCKWVENGQFVKFCCSFCGRRAPQSARILLSNSWFICDWYCSLFLAFNPAESKISGHQAFAELAKTCFYVDTKCDFQTWPLLISLHWCKPSRTHESSCSLMLFLFPEGK